MERRRRNWAIASVGAASLAIATRSTPLAQTSDWRAPPTTQIQVADRTFRDGAVQLSGTLYLPAASSSVPAVVVLHGASEPSRDAALYRHLKQMLPPLGVAVFVFDRRGTGKSGGKPVDGDYLALAEDGIAAQRMLAQDRRIDPKRIGFWGLSQGGWISLLAASHSPDAAFAISVSAPMTTPDVQMRFAVANILRIRGYPQADIDTAVAARKAVDDFERGRLDRATAQRRVDAAASKPWFDLIYMNRTFHDPAQSGWAKEIRNDPLATLQKLKAPALIIYGSRDPWVPVQLSVGLLKAQARGKADLTTVVVAGANHEMELTTSDAAEVDPKTLAGHAPQAPEYFAVLASWLTRHGFAHVQK